MEIIEKQKAAKMGASDDSCNITLMVNMRSMKTTCYTTYKAVADTVHIIDKGRQGSTISFHFIQKGTKGREVSGLPW